MYLVSKESNRKCRRSSDLKKVDVHRRTMDKSISDKLRLTKVSGANKNTSENDRGSNVIPNLILHLESVE